MTRKMLIVKEDGTSSILSEQPVDNEMQLQELVKLNPDLLPVDEFGFPDRLLVVGRETMLPSGAIDLVAVTRGGEIILVEFKTGPKNSDFRRALAQLLDYGSDLWRLTYEEFQTTVAQRYFQSANCQDSAVCGKASLLAAATAIWSDLMEEEATLFKERLTRVLASGAINYVLVAQRFVPSMERSIRYLNAISRGARFFTVELVRFGTGSLAAFESRAIIKPEVSPPPPSPGELPEDAFLAKVPEVTYREALQDLLELCSGLGLERYWGTAGVSLRLRTNERRLPLSVGWLFPPKVSGFMGLTDVTLGIRDDLKNDQLAEDSALQVAIAQYLASVRDLPGATPTHPKLLEVYRLSPEVFLSQRQRVAEILAILVHTANS